MEIVGAVNSLISGRSVDNKSTRKVSFGKNAYLWAITIAATREGKVESRGKSKRARNNCQNRLNHLTHTLAQKTSNMAGINKQLSCTVNPFAPLKVKPVIFLCEKHQKMPFCSPPHPAAPCCSH
jgi:hypothetical protein